MSKTAGFLPLGMICVLAACGGSQSGQDVEEDKTVFDDMIQTQDRARAVEDLTLGRKDQMDAAIEQSEGDGSE